MSPETSILVGGFFFTVLVIFHLTFWKLFRWKSDLAKLTSLNRAVMQVLNLSLTIIFAIFAYISFLHPGELLSTPIGLSLLLLISLFWYARALQQVIFFGLKKKLSIGFLLFFLIGGSLYLWPLIS